MSREILRDIIATALGRPTQLESLVVLQQLTFFEYRDIPGLLIVAPVASCFLWDERGIAIVK